MSFTDHNIPLSTGSGAASAAAGGAASGTDANTTSKGSGWFGFSGALNGDGHAFNMSDTPGASSPPKFALGRRPLEEILEGEGNFYLYIYI